MAEEEVSRQPLQPALAAFGNPLLDIIVSDEAGQLVQQFDLARDVAQEFDTVGTGLFAQAMERCADWFRSLDSQCNGVH